MLSLMAKIKLYGSGIFVKCARMKSMRPLQGGHTDYQSLTIGMQMTESNDTLHIPRIVAS